MEGCAPVTVAFLGDSVTEGLGLYENPVKDVATLVRAFGKFCVSFDIYRINFDRRGELKYLFLISKSFFGLNRKNLMPV